MSNRKKPIYENIKLTATGFEGVNNSMLGCRFTASFPLFLIRQAWKRGCKTIEQHADGFGAGMGTCGGDWSGIRDSSTPAVEKMLEESLNFLFK